MSWDFQEWGLELGASGSNGNSLLVLVPDSQGFQNRSLTGTDTWEAILQTEPGWDSECVEKPAGGREGFGGVPKVREAEREPGLCGLRAAGSHSTLVSEYQASG